jgi:hypothetical protein
VADRRDQKEALRAQRLERERAAAAAQKRKRLVLYVVAGLAALAAVGAVLAFSRTGGGDDPRAGGLPDGEVPPQRETNLARAVEAAGCTLERFREEGNDHVEGRVEYRSKPPHSGDHNIVPAEDGAYSEAPALENVVHALEHGRVVIQYKPSVSDDVKGNLKALFDEDPSHMLLVPDRSGMPYEVAATAWSDPDAEGPKPSLGRVLGCPRMNDRVFDALRAFRQSFRDRGPEYVP